MQEVAAKPIRAYYSGTVGADHTVNGTGVRVANDAAEIIGVTVGGVTFQVKQNETFDDVFLPFTSVTVDPTTSLGTKQVETATLAVGNVTVAGNMATVVTGARITGSPVTVLTAVTTADNTPAKIMTKVRASLAANAAITAAYAVSGADASVILTESPRAKANDATLNIDLGGTGTTATGITQVASSTDTTAGVAPTTIGYRLWVRG